MTVWRHSDAIHCDGQGPWRPANAACRKRAEVGRAKGPRGHPAPTALNCARASRRRSQRESGTNERIQRGKNHGLGVRPINESDPVDLDLSWPFRFPGKHRPDVMVGSSRGGGGGDEHPERPRSFLRRRFVVPRCRVDRRRRHRTSWPNHRLLAQSCSVMVVSKDLLASFAAVTAHGLDGLCTNRTDRGKNPYL